MNPAEGSWKTNPEGSAEVARVTRLVYFLPLLTDSIRSTAFHLRCFAASQLNVCS